MSYRDAIIQKILDDFGLQKIKSKIFSKTVRLKQIKVNPSGVPSMKRDCIGCTVQLHSSLPYLPIFAFPLSYLLQIYFHLKICIINNPHYLWSPPQHENINHTIKVFHTSF